MWDQDQWVGVPGDPGQGNEGLSCRTLEHWSLLLFIDVLTLNLRPKEIFLKKAHFVMMKYFNILKHLLSLSPLKYFLFLNIFILDSSLKKKNP